MRRWRWLLAVLLVAALVAGAIVAAARIPFSSASLRHRVIETLADRLDADVELQDLTLRLLPRVHAVGTGLTIRSRAMPRHDGDPPLIAVARFVVDADLAGLWRRRVAHVELQGLDIEIPPGRRAAEPAEEPAAGSGTIRTAAADPSGTSSMNQGQQAARNYLRQVVIDELEAPDAKLVVLRRDRSKAPRVWLLHQLRMQSVGADMRMPFESVLTNAVPPGLIDVRGTFGPWQRDDPGRTPLDGRFTFDNADLGVFGGIGGTLSARGTFGGQLDRLETNGETHTPDFMIDISQHAIPLDTTYRAVIDATDGTTMLDPVKAKFLDTSITATGGVYERPGQEGRTIELDVTMEDGHMADLMRLAVNSPKAPMTGRVHLKTTLVIPPGKRDVVDKLTLNGRFFIEGGRFTDAGVQTRINELSRRARGRGEPDRTRVASNFNGAFSLANSRLSLPVVRFDVPGAIVDLKGSYGLRRGELSFDGALYMDAKLSQTVSGFKSILLKPVDLLFRRNGRTLVPLTITGTRNDPKFGVNVRRALLRSGPAEPRPSLRR